MWGEVITDMQMRVSYAGKGRGALLLTNEGVLQAHTSVLVWGCLLDDFKVGLSVVTSNRQICQAFENNAVSERTAKYWFQNSDLFLCGEQ